jgi:hypothetical protein
LNECSFFSGLTIGHSGLSAAGAACRVILPQQLRQLGEVGRDPPGIVPYGMVEKIDIATVSTLRRSANNLLALRRGCANAALISKLVNFEQS